MSNKVNTQKQKKLINLISENLGTKGFTKTMYQMMLEAGYSEKNARQQSTILDSIKDKVKPIVDRLKDERDRALALMSKKITDAKYRDLVDSTDKMTRNIQLLSDKPTDNIKNILTKEQVDEILTRRTKKDNASREVQPD